MDSVGFPIEGNEDFLCGWEGDYLSKLPLYRIRTEIVLCWLAVDEKGGNHLIS